MRVISYGGGVQSTALIVLAVRGEIGPVDAALFANVGDDSEDPETLLYVRKYILGRSTLPVYELHRRRKDGSTETLLERMTREGSRSLPIPVRGSIEGAPGARTCTMDWKIRVIGKWLLSHGVTVEQRADVMIGFSLDEISRVNDNPKRLKKPTRAELCQRRIYPLLDKRLTRDDCMSIIRRAGLPIPPKSSCYFCPYHKPSVWAELRRDRPALFYKSAHLESLINQRREARGKEPMYLTRFGKPLPLAINGEINERLDFGTGPGAESCDEGYCWT